MLPLIHLSGDEARNVVAVVAGADGHGRPAGEALAHVAVEAARNEQLDGPRCRARQRVEQRDELHALVGAALVERVEHQRRLRVRVDEAEEQALAVSAARPRRREAARAVLAVQLEQRLLRRVALRRGGQLAHEAVQRGGGAVALRVGAAEVEVGERLIVRRAAEGVEKVVDDARCDFGLSGAGCFPRA